MVWCGHSSPPPREDNPGRAFQSSGLRHSRGRGPRFGAHTMGKVWKGAAAMENSQVVAPVCQARLGPVTPDTGILTLTSPTPLSPLPLCCPSPHQKLSASQQGLLVTGSSRAFSDLISCVPSIHSI